MYSGRKTSFDDCQPSFSNLPMEILIHIFRYLHPNDRLSAGLTCHQWLEATRHYLFINDMFLNFEKVHLTDSTPPISLFLNSFREFPNIVLSQAENCDSQEFWRKFGDKIWDITIRACDIRERVFSEILKKLLNLRTLRIEACRELFMSGRVFESEKDRAVLTKSLENVTTLSLIYNRYLSDALFNRIVSLVPNLKSLDLSGCHISFHKGLYRKFYPGAQSEASESVLTFHYISQFICHRAGKMNSFNFSSTLIDGNALSTLSEIPELKLECLNLNSCDQLTNPGIITLIQKQTSLQYLDLSKTVRLTDQCVLEICQYSIHLKSLKLRRCRAITDLGVKEIVNLKKLEVLDISECEAITGQGIIEGIASKKNVSLLELYVSSLNLCEESVIKIAENIPTLRLLDLSFCMNSVTDLCLQMIFKNLIWLRVLNLDCCDKISDAAMTGIGMFEKVSAFESNKNGSETQYAKERIMVPHNPNGEELPMDVLNRFIANHQEQPYKISLRSKAEQEIVDDAKRKQAMLEVCEMNTSKPNESSGYSIARLRGLRVLRLSQCNRLSDVSLIYSFKLRELKEISLAKCQQISMKGIQALILNCPSLEIVELSECHNINDKAVEMITVYLKRLHTLSVERCVQLSDHSLDSIAINCKSLRILDVKGCRQMCPEPNLRLTNLSSLRTIHMSKPGPYLSESTKKPAPPPMPKM